MRITMTLAVLATLTYVVGCSNSNQAVSQNGRTPTSQSHSHDHDHEHGEGCCQTGPNGGTIFKFEQEEYLGEFAESRNKDAFRFYILNSNEEDLPLKVERFTVTPEAGKDSLVIELEVESPDADGKSHIYYSDHRQLKPALRTGARVEVIAGDLVLTGRVEAHEHHGH